MGSMPTRAMSFRLQSPLRNKIRRLSVNAEMLMVDEDKEPGCCDNFYFMANSKGRTILDFVQLFNLLFISIWTPMNVGFNIPMHPSEIILEIISLCISLFVVIMKFRTPVVMKGGSTLEFKSVLSFYFHNGLILDLFALLPFNLFLQNVYEVYLLIVILRLLRMVSVYQIMAILG